MDEHQKILDIQGTQAKQLAALKEIQDNVEEAFLSKSDKRKYQKDQREAYEQRVRDRLRRGEL